MLGLAQWRQRKGAGQGTGGLAGHECFAFLFTKGDLPPFCYSKTKCFYRALS